MKKIIRRRRLTWEETDMRALRRSYYKEHGETTKTKPAIKRTFKLEVAAEGEPKCLIEKCKYKATDKRRCAYHAHYIRRSVSNATKKLMDQDYKHKLNADEKAWLKAFNNNYYLNQFADVTVLTPEQKRKASKFNEIARKSVVLDLAGPIPPEKGFANLSPEDAIIEVIDLKRKMLKK